MNRVKLFNLVLIIFLSGCATNYVEQTAGDLARVRFVANGGIGITAINLYKSRACEGRMPVTSLIGRTSFELFPKAKRLGIPLWDYSANAAKEFNMPANIEQNIMIVQKSGGLGPHFTCGTFFQVTYDKNRDYEIIFDNKQCSATVYELRMLDGSAKKRFVNKYSSAAIVHSACLAEFKGHAD